MHICLYCSCDLDLHEETFVPGLRPPRYRHRTEELCAAALARPAFAEWHTTAYRTGYDPLQDET